MGDSFGPGAQEDNGNRSWNENALVMVVLNGKNTERIWEPMEKYGKHMGKNGNTMGRSEV